MLFAASVVLRLLQAWAGWDLWRRQDDLWDLRHPHRAARASQAEVGPMKAGGSVFQPLLLTKTVFHAYRGAQPLFHALFGVKTLSETLFPVCNERG